MSRRMEGPDAHSDVGSNGEVTYPLVASVPSDFDEPDAAWKADMTETLRNVLKMLDDQHAVNGGVLTRVEALEKRIDALGGQVRVLQQGFLGLMRSVERLTSEAMQKLEADWREKARQLRGYDGGMHEVVNCADELAVVLAKASPK